MGVVYLAHDPVIEREVALKTLRVDLDSEMREEFRERFVREARAAGRLNHPSIVTIHDVGEDPGNGLLFIAMERIEGQNLKELMASGHRFDPDEAARIAAAVARALAYAHGQGVVHRDIKPANIILTPGGTPKITDFGVAHLESSNLTVEGQFIGTPNYMSPEQIAGIPLDGRSDLFSLGVVLYELLVGRRPFEGATIVDLSRKIVEQPPPIPSQVGPHVPAAFNPIVLRCLEKDPARRFGTASLLAEALDALLRSRGKEPSAGARTATPASTGADTTVEESETGRSWDLEGLRSWWHELPMPPVLRAEVDGRWIAGTLLGWLLLWGTVLTLLAGRIDRGPFLAPPESRIRVLHRLGMTLRKAEEALVSGDYDGAIARARTVLHQAPASPAARAIVGAALERAFRQRQGEETRSQVEALIAEGRRLFHQGRYRSAASRFQKALELDPENDLAESFLELARARSHSRSSLSRRRSPPARPTDTRASSTAAAGAATCRLTLSFDSPLNAGTILLTMNGKTFANISFDFTRKGFLGIKRHGTGLLRRSLLLPAGQHTLAVQLNDAKRGPLGSSSFTRRFEGDSVWTLRIDLSSAQAEPAFYLVQASR